MNWAAALIVAMMMLLCYVQGRNDGMKTAIRLLEEVSEEFEDGEEEKEQEE